MKHYRFTFARCPFFQDVEIHCQEYEVAKETPSGFWLTMCRQTPSSFERNKKYIWKKWVSKDSRKRFAYPTKKEALESFLARKRKQLFHAEQTVKDVNGAIKLAESVDLENIENYYSQAKNNIW